MLPNNVQKAVIKLLQAMVGNNLSIKSFTSISGGCINSGGELKTSSGSFFIKWNDTLKYPGMFESEVKGLALLSSAAAIRTPQVIGSGEALHEQFIVMESVKAAQPSSVYWVQLGERLASLHRHTYDRFGLDHANYIGSLKQLNTFSNSWIDFFIENRLNAQVKLAVDTGRSDATLTKKFDGLYQLLHGMLPDEKPSLLHGDLWSGNLIVDEKGEPCLIDPAVYYGNREAELAFTKLFGGFPDTFYRVYNNSFPLQNNFDQRIDIYNLYPLLVHVNLFGGHYLNQLNSILNSVL
jgi:protein-ribulosamine 3-kinase